MPLNISRIYLFILLIPICTLIGYGCSDDSSDGNVVFDVAVSEIGAYTAKITVTHNATNRDAYYGFAVEGTVADINAEIEKFISSSSEEERIEAIHHQRKSVFSATRLRPQTTFTYIVFGMNDDGQLYGKPASAVFTTGEGDLTAEWNPNWNIKYWGYTVYDDRDYTLVAVYLNGDVEERFFLATYTEESTKKYDRVEDLIVEAANDFIENRNKGDEAWLEDNEVRTESTAFYRYLSEGEYVFYAIGINADGSPTGHYVCTPTIHVEKYPACEGYTNLLGEWVMIDENDKWYFVTFTEKIVNKSLTMTGWGNYDDYPIHVVFDRTKGGFNISSQTIFENGKIELHDGTTYKGALSFRGAYYNEESVLKWTTNTNLTLAKATLNDDGTYTVATGFYVTMSNGDRNYNTGITYYGEAEDGTKFGFARMMFPLKMKKVDDL